MMPDKHGAVLISQNDSGIDNEDYISNLPDDIISEILSRLSTTCAVRTCVLSKAWEFMWTSIYKIDIYDAYFDKRKSDEGYIGEDMLTFVNFMDRLLLHSQNLRMFCFASIRMFGESCMEAWLSIVFSRNIEDISIFSQQITILPSSLSSCTSLKRLSIHTHCYWKAPVKNCFPNLTMLYLSKVDIVNENPSTDTLVFHFPVLETYEMSHKWSNVKFVEIYAPALISFKSDTTSRDEVGGYVIKIIGARLQKFDTCGGYLEDFNLTASTVSSATVMNGFHFGEQVVESGLNIRTLLNEFSSLKSLTISCCLTTALGQTKSGFPRSCLKNLERLTLSLRILCSFELNLQGFFEGLLELLDAAPLLKSLSIDVQPGFYDENYNDNTLDSVPSCVVSHLEKVKFDHFAVRDSSKLRLAMFFLEHGARLKKLSVHTVQEKEEEIAEQLAKFPKASNGLKIVIKGIYFRCR